MKTVLGILSVFILVVVILAVSFAWTTWLIMLLLGILNSVWDSVPALGFWETLPIGIILTLLLGGTNASSHN